MADPGFPFGGGGAFQRFYHQEICWLLRWAPRRTEPCKVVSLQYYPHVTCMTWILSIDNRVFAKFISITRNTHCKRTEMHQAKDTLAVFLSQIKMQQLHLLPRIKMLSLGMKIPTLEIKNEIRLKITIANFPGCTRHVVKGSTCHQDKIVNSIFIPDKDVSEGVSSLG